MYSLIFKQNTNKRNTTVGNIIVEKLSLTFNLPAYVINYTLSIMFADPKQREIYLCLEIIVTSNIIKV